MTREIQVKYQIQRTHPTLVIIKVIPAGRRGKCGFESIYSEKSDGNSSASILKSSHMAERIALGTFLRSMDVDRGINKSDRPKTNHFMFTCIHFLYHDVSLRG